MGSNVQVGSTSGIQTHFQVTLHLLLSRLNSSISLSLFYVRCSNPPLVFVALRWTHSSTSMSLLYERMQNQTQHIRFFSEDSVYKKDHFSQPAGNALPNVAQEAHLPDLHSWCPSGSPGPSHQSCLPSQSVPAYTGARGYSSWVWDSLFPVAHEDPVWPFLPVC